MKVRTGKKVSMRVICLIVVVLMATVLSGCTTFDSFRHAFFEETDEDQMPGNTIGVFEPQTGRNSEKGKSELKGENTGVKEFRKFVVYYTKGMRGAANVRREVNYADTAERMIEIIESENW